MSMLEDILGALVRSQVGDLRRRTTGAILESAGLGMIGLSVVFLFIGLYAGLSRLLEPWLAALFVSALALVVAVVLMLFGRQLLRRKSERDRQEAFVGLNALGLLSGTARKDRGSSDEELEAGPSLVVAALTAGLVLGRSMKL